MLLRNKYSIVVLCAFLITVGFILFDSYQLELVPSNNNKENRDVTIGSVEEEEFESTEEEFEEPEVTDPPPTTKPPLPTTQSGPYITFVLLTADGFKETRTKAIRETWAKRAVAKGWRVFYYSETDMGSPNDTIPTLEEDKSGYGNDKKQWRAWGHANNEQVQSTWYIKVDDDAYLHVDRLEKTLAKLDPEGVKVYGRCDNFTWEPKPFCDGGSAIILTRGALAAMMKWYYEGKCKDTGHNDLSTSWCFVDNGAYLTPIPGLHGEPPANWHELSTDITWHHLDPDGVRRVDNIFYYK